MSWHHPADFEPARLAVQTELNRLWAEAGMPLDTAPQVYLHGGGSDGEDYPEIVIDFMTLEGERCSLEFDVEPAMKHAKAIAHGMFYGVTAFIACNEPQESLCSPAT